jgi:hypothetical protein
VLDDFYLFHMSILAIGLTQPPYLMGIGGSFSGCKAAEYEGKFAVHVFLVLRLKLHEAIP